MQVSFPPSDLDSQQMLAAFGLIAVTIALSIWHKLALTQNFLIAIARSILQLLLVGALIDAAFDLNHPAAVGLVLFLLSLVAAKDAANRVGDRFQLVLPLLWIAIAIPSLLVLIYLIAFVIQPTAPVPWYAPQHLIPVGGILLGSTASSVAIAAEKFSQTIRQRLIELEIHLSLGATPQQALVTIETESIRAAMLPITNTMTTIAIAALPIFFTGLMLGGVSPLLAIRYQFVVLFAIALTSLFGAISIVKAIGQQCFNQAQQIQIP